MTSPSPLRSFISLPRSRSPSPTPSLALSPTTTTAAAPAERRRAWAFRALALLCACSLSVGSHYGRELLGPLKTQLLRRTHSSNVDFSLIISAYSLNSTWTPLIAGLLTVRLGAPLSSILATALIFTGQFTLLLGSASNSVPAMLLGMLIFGLGVSPLAVVQETLIIRFFLHSSLGTSLALGLLAGKGASFLSSLTAYPLSSLSPQAPFLIATALAAFSCLANFAFLGGDRWLARGAGVQEERREAERRAAERKTVRVGDLARLGDRLWVYVAFCGACGAVWTPFQHNAAHIIQERYGLSEGSAATTASFVHAASLFLYPITGFVVDRYKSATIVLKLFILSSILTFSGFLWLALPPNWTRTPIPAIFSFGIGQGFATLLLVVIVPHLVPYQYTSTALGVHKSAETALAVLSQTTAGLILDGARRPPGTAAPAPVGVLLRFFLLLNALQLCAAVALWQMQVTHEEDAALAGAVEEEDGQVEVEVGVGEERDVRLGGRARRSSETPLLIGLPGGR